MPVICKIIVFNRNRQSYNVAEHAFSTHEASIRIARQVTRITVTHANREALVLNS